MSAEQAKSFKGKALPPYLNGTKSVYDLAFKDTFVQPITKLVFLVKTEDGIELKINDETLVGKNTHNPEFLDTIRDAFVEVAKRYAKLLPKFDYTDYVTVEGIEDATGVYTIQIMKTL